MDRLAVDEMIGTELAKAQAKFAPFNSDHEGYAVLLEEVEELSEDWTDIGRNLDHLWAATRRNDRNGARAAAEAVGHFAALAAAEAIQVGAMARRFLADLPGTEDAA